MPLLSLAQYMMKRRRWVIRDERCLITHHLSPIAHSLTSINADAVSDTTMLNSTTNDGSIKRKNAPLKRVGNYKEFKQIQIHDCL